MILMNDLNDLSKYSSCLSACFMVKFDNCAIYDLKYIKVPYYESHIKITFLICVCIFIFSTALIFNALG